jgi:hypothetical protein
LLRLGVDGNQDDVVTGFKIVDTAITGTFTFLNVAVLKTYLEDGQADPRNLIAGQYPCAKLIYKRLNVGTDGAEFLASARRLRLNSKVKEIATLSVGIDAFP